MTAFPEGTLRLVASHCAMYTFRKTHHSFVVILDGRVNDPRVCLYPWREWIPILLCVPMEALDADSVVCTHGGN